MDARDRLAIKNIVDSIRNAINIGDNETTTLEGLDNIITRLGGSLEVNSNLMHDAEIIKISENNSKFRIQYSPFQSEVRRNFSIAHELGHLFLHMLYLIDNNIWENLPEGSSYKRVGSNEMESQANEFAAELLMPKEVYLEELSRNKYLNCNKYNIEPVAKRFNVSEQAAINRGRWLGVLSWE